MKSKLNLVVTLLVGLAMNSAAFADDAPDADDATITVVGEDETPDDVVKVIELPAQASANATENSADSKANADAAKDKGESGRDFGQEVSEEARNNNGAQVRDDATQQAHNDARNDNASDKHHGPKQ